MAQITPAELGLAGIAGTLVGAVVAGVIAYSAQRWSTLTSLRADPERALDDRLWHKRADLYVQLFGLLESVMDHARQLARSGTTQSLDACLEDTRRLRGLTLAEIRVYSSSTARLAWHALTVQHMTLTDVAIVDLEDGAVELSSNARRNLALIANALDGRIAQLEEVLRKDLQGGRAVEPVDGGAVDEYITFGRARE